MEELDFWRLCDELSIFQAALLTVGVDPSSAIGSTCEDMKLHERPQGYDAAKLAITTALRRGEIKGHVIPLDDHNHNGEVIGVIAGSMDAPASKVEVNSLKFWLAKRGIKTGFFAPATVETTDYLDPRNPRYAPKLAAGVHAWQAVTDPHGKTPKQALVKWLREHGSEYELTDDEGKPNETAIDEIAKIANWQPGGGAPKTPGE